jgi:hypothetical protein
MRSQIVIACVVVLLGCARSSSAQTVSLQFDNGLVTLNAQNAPVRTILAEWARLGGTRFLNADRIGGPPATVELTAIPERQALEILLRSVAGYVVTQREGGGVSRLGAVAILPTSAAVRAPAPVTFGASTVQQQRVQEDALNDPNGDDRQGQRSPAPGNVFTATPPITNAPAPGIIRVVNQGTPNAPFGSVTETQPQPAGMPGPAVVRPPTMPQALPGTSRPGEITPQPPPQQQPGQPNQR